ncbi:hypothetical protein [Planotetraspora mira]|jgi:hypothetical protein|uniref:Uncharacterized protein n=1 Tax=Planotetraspora mira TaxID=58121 RepID=A0A8J3X6B7_9ACTN|nr:hypothetical protein [Planotetraspora mira]GII28624.1 hypothetical protein Pmi06nite_20660 [Planotetraspora mira]
METSPTGEEYLLITSKDRALPSVVILCLTVAVLAGGYLTLRWVSQHIHGFALGLAYSAGGLLLLLAFWVVDTHVTHLMNWAFWRRRGVPAMRLTPAGLDYSAAFAGTFPLHVPWDLVEGCGYRPNSDGHPFWCAGLHPVAVMDAVPASIFVRPVPPIRAREVAEELARTAAAEGESVDVGLLTHMLAFGTPVAINLHRVHGVPLAEVDEKLREWTHGRCSFRADTRGPGFF